MDYLTYLWGHTTEPRYVSLLVVFYFINFQINATKNIGLYRDDGLAVFKNKSGPQADRIKKHFQKIFRENDLNIVIKCNLKIVDYLDVTLNLLNNTYKPFSKPNNKMNYIHRESNHSPSIIK